MRILVVDDETMKVTSLVDFLNKSGHTAAGCENGMDAIGKLSKQEFDVLVSDMRLPDVNGLELLKHAKSVDGNIEVIIMTAYGTIDSAVKAIKSGANDYITKPFPNEEILVKLKKISEYKNLKEENIFLKKEIGERYQFGNIIGKNIEMMEIFNLIKIISPTDSTALITGESGTGKELVAYSIHANSPRKDNAFIKVSCAVLAENLLETELFGHERGAFTDAVSRKRGRFELADGGTIFLDDIDDIPLSTQVKLLRVLQEREFERVGGEDTVKVDVRVIAASKSNLEERVRQGKFREDLFYRLNVISIALPLLRNRKDDVPLLVEHFIRKYATKTGKRIMGIDSNAMEVLIEYEWPGNIRELENVVERAVVLCSDDTITIEKLPKNLMNEKTNGEISRKIVSIDEVVNKKEREHIIRILRETGGKKGESAQLLGISRKTLWEKMKSYNIRKDEILP